MSLHAESPRITSPLIRIPAIILIGFVALIVILPPIRPDIMPGILNSVVGAM